MITRPDSQKRTPARFLDDGIVSTVSEPPHSKKKSKKGKRKWERDGGTEPPPRKVLTKVEQQKLIEGYDAAFKDAPRPTKSPPTSIFRIKEQTGLDVSAFDGNDKEGDGDFYVYLLTCTVYWSTLTKSEKELLVQLTGSAAEPEGGTFHLYYVGYGSRARAFTDHKSRANPENKHSEFMSPLLWRGINNGSAESFKVAKFSAKMEAEACTRESTTYDDYRFFQLESNLGSTLCSVLVNLERPHSKPTNYKFSAVFTVVFEGGSPYTFSFAGGALKKAFEVKEGEREDALKEAAQTHIIQYLRRAREARQKGFDRNDLEVELLGRTRDGGKVPPPSSFTVHFAGPVESSKALREIEQDQLLEQVFEQGGNVLNTLNAIKRVGQPPLSALKSAVKRRMNKPRILVRRGQTLENAVHKFELERLGLEVTKIGDRTKVTKFLRKVEDLRELLPARNCEEQLKRAVTEYPSEPLKGLMILYLSTVTGVDFGASFEGGAEDVKRVIDKFNELISVHNGQEAVIKSALTEYPSEPLKGLVAWELSTVTGDLNLEGDFSGDAKVASCFLNFFYEQHGRNINKKKGKSALKTYRDNSARKVKKEKASEAYNKRNDIVATSTQTERSARTLALPSQKQARKKERFISLAKKLLYFEVDVEAARVMGQFKYATDTYYVDSMKYAHILRKKYIEDEGLTVEKFEKKRAAEKEEISKKLTKRVFEQLSLKKSESPKKKRKTE